MPAALLHSPAKINAGRHRQDRPSFCISSSIRSSLAYPSDLPHSRFRPLPDVLTAHRALIVSSKSTPPAVKAPGFSLFGFMLLGHFFQSRPMEQVFYCQYVDLLLILIAAARSGDCRRRATSGA